MITVKDKIFSGSAADTYVDLLNLPQTGIDRITFKYICPDDSANSSTFRLLGYIAKDSENPDIIDETTIGVGEDKVVANGPTSTRYAIIAVQVKRTAEGSASKYILEYNFSGKR